MLQESERKCEEMKEKVCVNLTMLIVCSMFTQLAELTTNSETNLEKVSICVATTLNNS